MNLKYYKSIAKAPRSGVQLAVLVMAGCSLAVSSGCHLVSATHYAVPANRLDPALIGCSKEGVAPLPYAALGQPAVSEHIIGPGDTLGVFVFGVFPGNEDDIPVQQRAQAVNQRYYPPEGTEVGPTTGLPVRVSPGGTIELPLAGSIPVAGLTIPQSVNKILEVYKAKKVLQAGREQVTVGLVMPRVHRVVVLREDTPATPVALVGPGANDVIHRGSGEVIDLPVYENDVLHALAATGGLPGTDAKRELWVIRNLPNADRTFIGSEQLLKLTQSVNLGGNGPEVIRIPLVGCPGEAIPFTVKDITLNEGDVLFVPRRNEYFVAGGLLPGARIALPRDEDVDVVEAIALATGSAGGPLGLSGAVLAGGNVGNLREPTRVLILRKLPDGRQLPIRVDLDRAMQDEKERILIQPEDVVMLQFKPHAAGMYGFFNYVPSTFVLPFVVSD